MIKVKKTIRIVIYVIMVYVIGFETFYYVKNDGNVILFVSNQSSQIDSADIIIIVDGREIVSDVFISGNFHNYKEYSLKLSPILLHEIEVTSEKAQVKMVTQIRFYFVNWVLLDLWDKNTNFEDSSNDNLQDVTDTKYEQHWFTIDRRLFPIILM